MSAREIQDQKAIAREMFVQQALTLMRTFRLAHCGGLRFAPSRVDVITLLNRQRKRVLRSCRYIIASGNPS